ncbi:hypothetical protein FIV42_22930 [Persicimonas caeni]|uniref:Uncharacterized protein n=1 Tax=Persicimonas caeni TaxID=2292766 RepID=A0A4Y6PYT3_PERCE|nr:hypothetical protein [Persicimonas caeni]QDG53494.1 hypothetical protein FIV42_22930 [Persicimonas caeni]QED34715.1 hypothetical protein FRD00_22925 [Persicimonas caeni]
MSNNVGKTIENRVKWGRWVVASLDVHGEPVSRKLDGRSAMSAAEWNQWFLGHRGEMHQTTEDLLGVALSLARERADDDEQRTQRDEATDMLRDDVGRTRSLLDSAGPSHATRFGLSGATPRSGTSLEAYARNAAEALREADETLDVMGVQVSTSTLADNLTPSVDRLSARLVGLAEEDRQAEALLVERDEMLERWERTYRAIAQMLEGAYRLAGEDELADRVRPTINRTSGAEAPDNDPQVDPVEPLVDVNDDEPVEA